MLGSRLQTLTREYRLAAKQGSSYAQSQLGDIYYKGEGEGVTQNYQEAIKWYRLAVECILLWWKWHK